MDNRRSHVNQKKRVRRSKWSIPAEFMLGTFFIGILLLIAYAANEMGVTAVITHNSSETYQGAEARIMPLGRPIDTSHDAGYVETQPPSVEAPKDTGGQIDCTYVGHERANTACTPSTYHLDAFFSQFGNDIGIYFKNLDTGFVYTSNPDTVFFAASLNKATYALYIYTAAERGYIDLYAVHTFTADDWWGGTGIIRFMPAGARLTTRELLRHAVVYSDNVAHRMLARYMSRIGFSYRDFVAEIGANPDLIRNIYAHYTNAADTAIWFYAINAYLESGSRYGHYLKYDLLNTAFYSHPYFTRGNRFGGDGPVNVQLLHSSYPVAQKYGWAVASFNVAGIIYAPSPFMLVIISNMDSGAHELFEEISWLMQEFNARYFY